MGYYSKNLNLVNIWLKTLSYPINLCFKLNYTFIKSLVVLESTKKKQK